MSNAFNDTKAEAPARLLMMVFASLTKDGVQFEPGQLRGIYGKHVSDTLATLKHWGMVTQDSTLTHIDVPKHIGWSNRGWVDGGASSIRHDHWIALNTKSAPSAITEAYAHGMPMWLALPLFVMATASGNYDDKGKRTLLMGYAELTPQFVRVSKTTGEVKEATSRTFKTAIARAKSYGLLTEESQMGRLACWTPATKEK